MTLCKTSTYSPFFTSAIGNCCVLGSWYNLTEVSVSTAATWATNDLSSFSLFCVSSSCWWFATTVVSTWDEKGDGLASINGIMEKAIIDRWFSNFLYNRASL